MNDRIRELAEQAEREVYPVTVLYKDEGAPRLNAQFEQKFAELIVRECAQVAKLTEEDDGDDYKSGRQWAGIDILKHFGVEE